MSGWGKAGGLMLALLSSSKEYLETSDELEINGVLDFSKSNTTMNNFQNEFLRLLEFDLEVVNQIINGKYKIVNSGKYAKKSKEY